MYYVDFQRGDRCQDYSPKQGHTICEQVTWTVPSWNVTVGRRHGPACNCTTRKIEGVRSYAKLQRGAVFPMPFHTERRKRTGMCHTKTPLGISAADQDVEEGTHYAYRAGGSWGLGSASLGAGDPCCPSRLGGPGAVEAGHYR